MSLGDALVKNHGDDLATDPGGLPTSVGPNWLVKAVPYLPLVRNRSLCEYQEAVRVVVPELDEHFASNGDLGKEYVGSI